VTFNSLQYALFLPLVLGLYWAVPRRFRQPLLLVASYVFYGLWDWRFLLLLMFTTGVDWAVGIGVDRLDPVVEQRRRRRLLLISITVNLVVLGFFKYADFFITSASELLGRAGLDPGAPVLRVVLPIGISFYTFQSIGYTVDVYRGRLPACRRLLDFATFVAFFPQLVAGPISRAPNLLPQIEADRARPTRRQVTSGLLLILLGLFKKVVLADPLAPHVANAFDEGRHPGTVMALTGMVAFAFQIYADFSGYSDIARGSARLLNVELVHNFEQPYLSRNITEFWRRWHISLSTWLRDYLYIPLGGNRGGAVRTYRNLMATMLLGGLWHGAGWNFVIWGGLHGLFLVVDRLRGAAVDASRALRARDVPAILATFALACLAWVFFRAHTFDQAVQVLRGVADAGGETLPLSSLVFVVALVGAAVALDLVQRRMVHPLRVVADRPALTGAFVGLALVGIIVFSGGAPVPFIYFQF